MRPWRNRRYPAAVPRQLLAVLVDSRIYHGGEAALVAFLAGYLLVYAWTISAHLSQAGDAKAVPTAVMGGLGSISTLVFSAASD